MKKVVLGLSGGVDSSLCAFLLKEQGYDVTALFMRNWKEEPCSAAEDYKDVEKVAAKLSIPYYNIDFSKEYFERVFQKCLDDFKIGLTPNPDILCNKEIKFHLFFEKALMLGADLMATGHYAKTQDNKLFKASDLNKDQSYFLSAIKGETLSKVIFPIGGLSKKQVRELAKKANLPTAEKKESMGICFIGKRNFRPFLETFLQKKEGDILTLDGKKVGSHAGVSFYTLGQRKDLRIGGAGEAWFVVKKDALNNILYVAQGSLHSALFCDELIAKNIHFIHKPPLAFPFSCKCKIRYRQEDQNCTIFSQEDGSYKVAFEKPQRAATPGQAIVFYQDDECLGNATIITAGPSYFERAKSLPAF